MSDQSAETATGKQILSDLYRMLDRQSKKKDGTEFCDNCGAICEHLPLRLWLDGDAEIFRVRLPFCPSCNPELFSRAQSTIE